MLLLCGQEMEPRFWLRAWTVDFVLVCRRVCPYDPSPKDLVQSLSVLSSLPCSSSNCFIATLPNQTIPLQKGASTSAHSKHTLLKTCNPKIFDLQKAFLLLMNYLIKKITSLHTIGIILCLIRAVHHSKTHFPPLLFTNSQTPPSRTFCPKRPPHLQGNPPLKTPRNRSTEPEA